jgi:hypothetical protein
VNSLLKQASALLLLSPPVLVSVWVVYRSFWVPGNHIGFDPLLLLWALVFSVLVALIGCGWLRVIAWIISVLTAGVIIGAMHFNLLLQYEDWIRLGMPDKPSWALAGQR